MIFATYSVALSSQAGSGQFTFYVAKTSPTSLETVRAFKQCFGKVYLHSLCDDSCLQALVLIGSFVLLRVDIHQILLCNFWIRTRASLDPPLTHAVTPRLLWKLVCEPMPMTVFRVALATADSL
jgi:hypothetical protein